MKWWGWGDPEKRLEVAEDARATLVAELGATEPSPRAELEDVTMPEARALPDAVTRAAADALLTGHEDRVRRATGKSYPDLFRARSGRLDAAPDAVVTPRSAEQVLAVLDASAASGVAVVPFGGGTSVVGGVEPRLPGRYAGAVTLDLRTLDRVLEIDPVSRAARIQAGAAGPGLESQLSQHGMTLRHFPQSFEFSTLGGWIATRAGGHFATLYTHIDDLVESVRAVTPAGLWESRRLPGSGAGPSPDRMLVGSEGILGVITEAWVRVQARPEHRASAGVRFPDFLSGAEAVRALSQSGLYPANCRLIDAAEAALTTGGDGQHALLVLGFESADHPVSAWMDRALELCREHGGEWDEVRGGGGREGAVSAWREAFLRAPYLRDTFVAMHVSTETFETAITWDRFPTFHDQVRGAAEEALREACGAGTVTCRFTHVYPDGPAPYYTMMAPARAGEELEQWEAVKSAASDAVIAAGGTITHHHAVGRDHRPWYDRQRPDPFAAGLRGAKAAVDPRGVLNPGVLVDP
jgi:alkyldihydroxyacetonephosphate synthase